MVLNNFCIVVSYPIILTAHCDVKIMKLFSTDFFKMILIHFDSSWDSELCLTHVI